MIGAYYFADYSLALMDHRLASKLYQRVFQYIKHTTSTEATPTDAKATAHNLDNVSYKAGKKAVPPEECLQLIIE